MDHGRGLARLILTPRGAVGLLVAVLGLTGFAIDGLTELEDDPELVVFHAGTRRRARGGFETAGGRVLGVTARGVDIAQATQRAYAAVDRIRFRGMQLRRDIAALALST